MRPRTSPIWTMPADEFRALVAHSQTMKDALNQFGLPVRGHNYRTFMARITEEEIDISHFHANRYRPRFLLTPLNEVLVAGRKCHGYHLKARLLRAGLLPDVCAECGLDPCWNGKPLSLQLDHINGDHLDNRLENLRLLCPNCHSQTATFAGKSKKGASRRLSQAAVAHCSQCGAAKSEQTPTGLCGGCSRRANRKVERPDFRILCEQVAELGYTGAGRLYGVSDNSIRKWLKQN